MSYPVTFYPCDGSQVRVVYEEEPTDPELDSAAGRIAYELDCAPEDVRVWKEWCEPYRDPKGWGAHVLNWFLRWTPAGS